MSQKVHPYIQLRRQIRQAGKQFRKNNDNSTNLFHPDGGFIYGYDLSQVEAALDTYETTLPTEFLSVENAASMENGIINDAQAIIETSESMTTRDFARQVMAYLVIHEKQKAEERKAPSLSLLKSDPSVPEDGDELG